MKNMYSILLILWSFSSCDEAPSVSTDDPTNLAVEVSLADDYSGKVSVSAMAENAIEYQFDMGDGSESIASTDGNMTYLYEATGSYVLETRAYGNSGRYLKETNQITIQVGEPVDPDHGYSTPLEYDGMSLTWNDEFNGSSLNESFWNYEIGTGSNGWGNNELQYYREQNTSVEDGYLTIEAREESFNSSQYTSSRLTTQNKFDFQYGRVDIRAKLPKGQGIWPALWMLGANFSSAGWPSCGETDIMEMIGGSGREKTVHGTCHWDNNGHASYGGSTSLSSGTFNDEFHVFSIVWDASSIKWYMDDKHFNTIDISVADLSEFQKEFFFIFNVAVGGNWPGSPDTTTQFPQQMIVDYIRVFQPE